MSESVTKEKQTLPLMEVGRGNYLTSGFPQVETVVPFQVGLHFQLFKAQAHISLPPTLSLSLSTNLDQLY